MGNRFSVGALTLGLLAALWGGGARAEAATGPSVLAASSILVDASDGRVLFEKSANERKAIASTTKILTALVVLERTKITDMVVASPRAEHIGADDPLVTELELTAGERLSIEDLLYGLLLPSANDAAVALAEHVGGSEDGFAELMMERAKQAGANHSSFVNPHGFDHPDQYSTARDLALITLEAWKIPGFRKIVATQEHRIPGANTSARMLKNRNQLLGGYAGADGVKTGQTRASGKSLVASATRNGEGRLAIVLSSPDPVSDSKILLDYGFDGFSRATVLTKGSAWGFVTSGSGRSMAVVPRATVSVLVESGNDPPAPRFIPGSRVLLIDLPGATTQRVKASLACVDECSPTNTGSLGKLLVFVTSAIRWF